MLQRIECRLIHRQQGAVLLVLAVIMSMIALGWLYGHMASRQTAGAVTARSLAVAQAALIGRALADPNHPGSLPCPDTNNDGIAETTVGTPSGNCPSYIGRLPWRTLGLSDIRDGNGERLWYALSSDARDYQYLKINSQNTAGELQVNSNANMVAVMLSPGVAIDPQQRGTQAQQNAVGNYLEGDNVNGDTVYVSQAVADPAFNDRLLALSSIDLFRKVETLILRQIAQKLTVYAKQNAGYPFAADQSGIAKINQLSGYIPYSTLSYMQSDALVLNNWFDALAAQPAQPYTVTVMRDQVHINLLYCHADMTLNTPLVVHCD